MSVKRLLDCTASEIAAYGKAELMQSIAGCEGRVLACETIGLTQPLLVDVTNAEYAASLSADLLLLNMFDVRHPVINALPSVPEQETVRELKRLTGNPGNGVNNDAIEAALREISDAVGDRVLLAAGKMHASGVIGEGGENLLTLSDVRRFAEAGADIILLPAPGTIPGITQECAHSLVEAAHSCGKLAMTAIGTSQEGADTATIRQIALLCKMAGADIHHIGDTGVPGMALPQNILAYSIAIRGERHTYHRMAQSINR